MNATEAWQVFCRTGSASDYLAYVSQKRAENEDKHGRIDTQTRGGR